MSDFNNKVFSNHFRSKEKPIRKVKHLIKFIEQDGWYIDRTKGSHRQFKHRRKSGTVPVPGKMNADVPKGTLRAILTQTGLK